MEKMIKKTKLLLYICLAMFLLNSCTEEKEYLENKNRDLKFSRKTFKDLLSFKDFNSAYQKVKSEKQKSIALRSAIEDEYNFTIKEDRDVKIIEKDSTTYYNILIEKDSVKNDKFYNLLLMVEKIENNDHVSAYIMEYAKSNGLAIFNGSNEITKKTLFARVSMYCEKACTPMCTIPDGFINFPHPFYSEDCRLAYKNCTTVCDPSQDLGTGGGNTGSGGTTSGGGNNGTGGTNTSSPSNSNSGGVPPELIILPVDEEEKKKTPCTELAKLLSPRKNPPPTGSIKISSAINILENSFSDIHENGFQFRIDGEKEYNARQLLNSSRFPNYVVYGNNPAVFGGGHSHTNLLQPMFSGQDAVKQLYSFYNNFTYYEGGIKDASIPVNILATENGIYALKIEDIEKLEAIHNVFNNQKKYKIFCDEIAEKQKDLQSSFVTNNSDNYEIEYLKTITNFQNKGYETGIALYKLFREPIEINGTTRVVERWKKAILTNNGTKIDFVPCEN